MEVIKKSGLSNFWGTKIVIEFKEKEEYSKKKAEWKNNIKKMLKMWNNLFVIGCLTKCRF